MPQILRIGPYNIYFWSNEGDPFHCLTESSKSLASIANIRFCTGFDEK